MSLRYIVQRISAFILTIIFAATLNFALPRLSPQDPIAALTGRMASRGQLVQGGDKLIAQYKQEFGLDKPLIVQYGDYMEKLLLHGDMGYSLAYFPTKVSDVVLRAVPWSLGLLVVSNLLAFVIGNLLGALAAWRSSPKAVKFLIYALMPLSSIPYYILAFILVYLFAMLIPIFPLTGTFTFGSVRGFDLPTLNRFSLACRFTGSFDCALPGWLLGFKHARYDDDGPWRRLPYLCPLEGPERNAYLWPICRAQRPAAPGYSPGYRPGTHDFRRRIG